MLSTAAPAERVRRLRERYGSHDKLAAALREQGTQATRQTVIRWEKGGGISSAYAEKLALLDGSSADAFRPPRQGTQFREVRRQVEDIRAEVRVLREEVSEIVAALESQGLAVRGERRGRRG